MTLPPFPDHYATLGVSPEASLDEIRDARNREAKFWSPDLYPGQNDADRQRRTEAMTRINAAWEVLRDDDTRREYDALIDELRTLDAQHAIVVSKRSSANYDSITAALANNERDLPIIVYGGDYEESITIDVSCRIIGLRDGVREVVIRSHETCITVLGGHSSISGISIRYLGEDSGVNVRASSLTLTNCTVSSKGRSSIETAGSDTQLHISDSIITCDNGDGIRAFHGVDLSCSNTTISQCGRNGISASYECKISLNGSRVLYCRLEGVSLDNSCDIEARYSMINMNSHHGIRLSESKGIILDCSIRQNSMSGIECEGNVDISISSSFISRNSRYGVLMYGRSKFNVKSSIFENNHHMEILSHGALDAVVSDSIIIHTDGNVGVTVPSLPSLRLPRTILVGDFAIEGSEDAIEQIPLWEDRSRRRGADLYVRAQNAGFSRPSGVDVLEQLQALQQMVDRGCLRAAVEGLRDLLRSSDDEVVQEQVPTLVRFAECGLSLENANAALDAGVFDEAIFAAEAALGLASTAEHRKRADLLLRQATYGRSLLDSRAEASGGHLEAALVSGVAALTLAPPDCEAAEMRNLVHSLTGIIAFHRATACADSSDWDSVTFWAATALSLDVDVATASSARNLVAKSRRMRLQADVERLLARDAWSDLLTTIRTALAEGLSEEDAAQFSQIVMRCEFELACGAASDCVARQDWPAARGHVKRATLLAGSLNDFTRVLRLERQSQGDHSPLPLFAREPEIPSRQNTDFRRGPPHFEQVPAYSKSSNYFWTILVGVVVTGFAAFGALVGLLMFVNR